MMLDDRDHRPHSERLRQARRDQADANSERDIGCAFWAAAGVGGLVVLLAGYGLAALSDRVLGALLAVLP